MRMGIDKRIEMLKQYVDLKRDEILILKFLHTKSKKKRKEIMFSIIGKQKRKKYKYWSTYILLCLECKEK